MLFKFKNPKYKSTIPPQSLMQNIKETGSFDKSITLVTFGGGLKKYRNAARALANDACKCGFFKEVLLYSDLLYPPKYLHKNVINRIPNWSNEDFEFIRNNKPGFGFWIWKPIIINSVLTSMKEGDYAVYLDGGCEISPLGIERLHQYIDICNESGGLFFQLEHSEEQFTKNELFEYLKTPKEQRISPQIQATFFVIKSCQETRALVEKWLALSRVDSMRLLTNERSPLKQSHQFIDHRNDQSILSLTVKQSNFSVIPAEDNFDSRLYDIINSWIFLIPFHSRRAKKFRKTFIMAKLSTEKQCKASLLGSWPFRLQFAFQSIIRRKLNFGGILAGREYQTEAPKREVKQSRADVQ